MAILRVIANHVDVESLSLDNLPPSHQLRAFKIVYIAPMKALAAEIVQKLSKRVGWMGVVVKELTGDMQLTKAEIASIDTLLFLQ